MLTDTRIRTLKARERFYRVADANGLCIEVRPNGSKVRLVCALQKSQVKHLASLTQPTEIAKLLKAIYSYKGSIITESALHT